MLGEKPSLSGPVLEFIFRYAVSPERHDHRLDHYEEKGAVQPAIFKSGVTRKLIIPFSEPGQQR